MDPRFFLPCFHGPRASRLGHKRKEKTRSKLSSAVTSNSDNFLAVYLKEPRPGCSLASLYKSFIYIALLYSGGSINKITNFSNYCLVNQQHRAVSSGGAGGGGGSPVHLHPPPVILKELFWSGIFSRCTQNKTIVLDILPFTIYQTSPQKEESFIFKTYTITRFSLDNFAHY